MLTRRLSASTEYRDKIHFQLKIDKLKKIRLIDAFMILKEDLDISRYLRYLLISSNHPSCYAISEIIIPSENLHLPEIIVEVLLDE